MSIAGSKNTAAAPQTLTVRVPVTIRRRGGRKRVLTPDELPVASAARDGAAAGSTVIKALARAFRWRELLENGTYATIEDVAAAERINTSYVSRVLRLTLLAPEIVETLLNGRFKAGAEQLLKPFSMSWPDQKRF